MLNKKIYRNKQVQSYKEFTYEGQHRRFPLLNEDAKISFYNADATEVFDNKFKIM